MRILDTIDLACRWICGIAMLTMVVAIFGQVFWRTVFDDFLGWAEETARYSFVWMVFMGSVSAFRARTHLGIDFLPELVGFRGRVVLDAFVCAFALAFGLALCVYGAQLTTRTMTQISPAIQLVMGYVYIAIPISAGLITLYAVVDLVRNVRALLLRRLDLAAIRPSAGGQMKIAEGEVA